MNHYVRKNLISRYKFKILDVSLALWWCPVLLKHEEGLVLTLIMFIFSMDPVDAGSDSL